MSLHMCIRSYTNDYALSVSICNTELYKCLSSMSYIDVAEVCDLNNVTNSYLTLD